ncbi:hypothetical protein HanIR_Chr02g0063531 [Helianthus annuus]|nr:hypothetical protein HanIR_Chr02g0063531 [Helianthus annuus]
MPFFSVSLSLSLLIQPEIGYVFLYFDVLCFKTFLGVETSISDGSGCLQRRWNYVLRVLTRCSPTTPTVFGWWQIYPIVAGGYGRLW